MGSRSPLTKIASFVCQKRYCYFRFQIPLLSNRMKSYLRYTVCENLHDVFHEILNKRESLSTCKVLINANVFPVFMIAFINIVRMELLWHKKYQN